ncbi:alanine racemase [Microterricola viridarii]|uniref:Alanine racemase n=1 Tax=Microterricola viridarii TaxID=412690 RepID=A0A1H1LFH2_9MICO|nr:alanine racemase [Microterricola viridarii]SDR73334.1 alanine racemase [Microterricola viridarii]
MSGGPGLVARPAGEPEPAVLATIDLAAIRHNVALLRERAGGAAVMVVVKADGYGHGAAACAAAALQAGAREIGVATIDEALALRAAGIRAPILAWLHAPEAQFLEEQFRDALEADIALGVSSIAQARAVRAIAATRARPVRVDLKLDTGLARNGAPPAEWAPVMRELAAAERESGLRVRGLFSHLACADEPWHPLNDVQAARFREGVVLARRLGLTPSVNHLANSAAALTRPDLAFDMVRAGIASYGLTPIPALGGLGLRPALALGARIALTKRIGAGDGVSYGHAWAAERAGTVALVPMGYADGLPRALSGRFSVRIGGRRYPAVGRICMDQFLVDLGDNPDGVRAGDIAALIGSTPLDNTLQGWSDELGTITYELATLLRGRTARAYTG